MTESLIINTKSVMAEQPENDRLLEMQQFVTNFSQLHADNETLKSRVCGLEVELTRAMEQLDKCRQEKLEVEETLATTKESLWQARSELQLAREERMKWKEKYLNQRLQSECRTPPLHTSSRTISSTRTQANANPLSVVTNNRQKYHTDAPVQTCSTVPDTDLPSAEMLNSSSEEQVSILLVPQTNGEFVSFDNGSMNENNAVAVDCEGPYGELDGANNNEIPAVEIFDCQLVNGDDVVSHEQYPTLKQYSMRPESVPRALIINEGGDNDDDDEGGDNDDDDGGDDDLEDKEIDESGGEPPATKKKRGMPRKTCQCDECGFVATTRQGLLKHVQVHSTTASHVCKMCGAAFKKSDYLNTHIKSKHSVQRDFACEYCSASFAWNSTRWQHVQAVHRGVRFRCSHCGLICATRRRMRQHLRQEHGTAEGDDCFEQVQVDVGENGVPAAAE